MAKDLTRKPQKVNAVVVFGEVKLSPKMAFEQSLVFQVPSENGCSFRPPNCLLRQKRVYGGSKHLFSGYLKDVRRLHP